MNAERRAKSSEGLLRLSLRSHWQGQPESQPPAECEPERDREPVDNLKANLEGG